MLDIELDESHEVWSQGWTPLNIMIVRESNAFLERKKGFQPASGGFLHCFAVLSKMHRRLEVVMMEVTVYPDSTSFGKYLSVSFQRTLRIPDDGKIYPLPPGLGRFPLYRVDQFSPVVPSHCKNTVGVFLPMHRWEALWIAFDAPKWRPCCVKVGVGRVNAVSGEPWDASLKPDRQDYLVCPPQLWLDGINAGEGFIRQFVAVTMDESYTVEEQVTGKSEFGGIQIVAFYPKLGLFPDEDPSESEHSTMGGPLSAMAPASEMGMAVGGKMRQKIYPDPYGIETWDPLDSGTVHVYLTMNSAFRELTGLDPPLTPIDAKTYTDYGLPWFELYDDEKADLQLSKALSDVMSVAEKAKKNGKEPPADDSFELEKIRVQKIGKEKHGTTVE